MRDLILKMSMSVDGYVAGGRAESDWMFRGSTPDSFAWVVDTIAGAGTHLVGRGLFETFVATWPTSPSPVAAPINAGEKAVVTRNAGYVPVLSDEAAASPSADSWRATRVLSGDLVEEITALKQEPGDYILAQGGTRFGRSLVAAGLVDEFRLAVLPVAIGHGDGIFDALPDELDLELVSTTPFSGGALGLVYRTKR